MSDYIIGRIDDLKCIICHGEENGLVKDFDILPIGTMPPNPTELLFSERLESLINQLRKEYDYIFIDCPPVEVVAAASIIARWADLTLFIVRAGLLERDMLPVIDGYYDERKFQNMALLLNGTEATHGGRYGYRYGYHYGYGNYSE